MFPQLPPESESWIRILRLLVQHGASVHEVVHGKTLAMLNIRQSDKSIEPKTLEFFRLLLSECYADFNTVDNQGCWSALLTAVRSENYALEALKFLFKVGANLTRIMGDGRTILHLAAELSADINIMEYLFSICNMDDLINRQDRWGCTALHYCMSCDPTLIPLQKINFLLSKGGDLEIKAYDVFHLSYNSEKLTPFALSKLLDPTFHKKLVEELKASGRPVPQEDEDEDEDEELFHDALHSQTTQSMCPVVPVHSIR